MWKDAAEPVAECWSGVVEWGNEVLIGGFGEAGRVISLSFSDWVGPERLKGRWGLNMLLPSRSKDLSSGVMDE